MIESSSDCVTALNKSQLYAFITVKLDWYAWMKKE